jgi:hypothetical protein
MRVEELHTPLHAVDVAELAQHHHDEFGGSREFSRDAVSRACFNCVLDKQREQVNCWVVYDDADIPVGYFAGTIHTSFYSDRLYAVQEMWFVLPRVRGTRAAIELLVQFERWANNHGVERIYTQVEHDADDELVERIFKMMNKLGYKKQGYIAVKVTNNKPNTKHEDTDNDRSTHRVVGAVEAQQ